MLHYPVNMAIGILNFSIWFLPLFFLFFCFLGRGWGSIYKFFSTILSSQLCVGCKALWYNEITCIATYKTTRDVTWLQAGGMGFVPMGHQPIKSRHFYQAAEKFSCWLIQYHVMTLIYMFMYSTTYKRWTYYKDY